MGLKLKSFFKSEDEITSDDEYYTLSTDEALKGTSNEGSKLILLEPRAYSESQQIADHLKNRHTVVVNLKRVTADQAKIYAIGGDLQKIGGGIFLCTPKNINVQGKISNDNEAKNDKIHDNSDIDIDF